MHLPPGIQQNRLLQDLTTFGIGGPSRYFTEARSIEDMQVALSFCKQNDLPYLILGKGSNSLFDDKGYDGMVILNKIDFLENPAPTLFHVGAGYSFSLLGTQTARQGLGGLEFASGIPASVGGAVWMNAGANGNETQTSLTSVDYITDAGDFVVLKKEDIQFAYRFSSFQKLQGAIVGATFELIPSQDARQRQIEIIQYRKKTQPLSAKSAGCIFRNPECGHAGAVIDQCGLKGLTVGGAQVSPLHANFIVNRGHATCEDVLNLIQAIKEQVHCRMNIELEAEVRHIAWSQSAFHK